VSLLSFLPARLNIEEEQPFDDLSRMLKEATSWEEKARLILERSASLYEFEDHMRYL
jgi:[histone H3]-trimethyl-L-lysine4 demethylase